MKVILEDAAQILNMSPDELMLECQQTDKLNPIFVPATDMVYLADGRVQFDESGSADATWEFILEELLEYKPVLDKKRKSEGEKKLSEAVNSALKGL